MKKKIFIDFYFIYTLLSIKNAEAVDIPLIIDLALQVWPQTYTPILGAEQVAYMMNMFYSPAALQKQMDEGHRFIVCFIDTAPVAFASWSVQHKASAKLHKIYVLPHMQGRGAGKHILGHLASTLISENVSRLYLNVNRFNHSAIAFYQKNGFLHAGDEDIDIGGGYFMNDHIFELTL